MIVVEHDEEAILAADHVLDLGPGAGVHGGEVVAQGTPAGDRGECRLDHRASISAASAQIAIPRDAHAADPDKRDLRISRRDAATTCRDVTRRYSARPVHLRHRRVRLRQVHADQRHAVQACVARI